MIWREAYEPLVGRKLEGFALMPMNGSPGDCHLTVGRSPNWTRFSLADLPMGFEERWAALFGATLISLSVFESGMGDGEVGAVWHHFSNASDLWIAVGKDGFDIVGEGDDLCVSLSQPVGAETLPLLMTIGGAT